MVKKSGRQDSNSGAAPENQALAEQDSQGASHDQIQAVDPDLKRVVEAWEKLPSGLKSAILAIVSSFLHDQ